MLIIEEHRRIMSEQLIPLGSVDETDTLGTSLHHAAVQGNKKTLKKVLDKGITCTFHLIQFKTTIF